MFDDARSQRRSEGGGAGVGDARTPASLLARVAPVAAAFALAWVVYAPALQGPLVSDDFGYLTSPYTQAIDFPSLSRMFDPAGDARLYTGNYAPIHLLAHAT